MGKSLICASIDLNPTSVTKPQRILEKRKVKLVNFLLNLLIAVATMLSRPRNFIMSFHEFIFIFFRLHFSLVDLTVMTCWLMYIVLQWILQEKHINLAFFSKIKKKYKVTLKSDICRSSVWTQLNKHVCALVHCGQFFEFMELFQLNFQFARRASFLHLNCLHK